MIIEPSGDEGRRPKLLPASLPTPTALADRLGVSATAVVLGLAGVIAAALGGWWALRPPPGPDPEEILPVVGSVSIPVPPPETTAPAPMVVHVAGAVKRPGVHELPAGSRVFDAVNAAGGLTKAADGSRLNLAQPISDGVRVWVPAAGEVGEPEVVHATAGTDSGSAADVSGAGPGGAKVNVNTADAAALQALPGIGPSLAAAIVEHRDRAGSFARVDDLDKVSGIGPAKLERLRPFVEV